MIASAQPSPTAVTIPDAQAPETKAPETKAPEEVSGGGPSGRSAALRAWLGPKGERLADKAMEFNRYPTRYAHPSWVPDGWAPWVARLAGRGVLESKLGEGLLAAWDLDARPCFDFAPPARRMVLMDAAPLRRTVLLAGLARYADEINHMMERGRVRELKEQVGESAYLFVMQRAPLLAGPLSAGANAAAGGKGWSARALAAGLGMLGDCLGADHGGLAARVLVKFPRDCAPYLGAGGGQGTAEGYLRLFRKVLVKEVDPAWDDLLS